MIGLFKNSELFQDVAAGLCAFLLTVLLVPLCKRLAYRLDLVDRPKSEQHKQHGRETPLLGGFAMFGGWILTLALAFVLIRFVSCFSGILEGRADFAVGGRELLAVVGCAFLSLLLGFLDDRKPMKASMKFGGQFLIALAVVLAGGLRISLFVPSELFSIAVTVLWIMFIFNAINFFDNMDGLAVGTASIAFAMFLGAALFNGQFFVAALCACSFGAAAGFWVFNFHPARMFMGDAGSHFLGFLLAVVSIKVSYYNPEFAGSRFAVLIPLIILAVPIFDALAVVWIRIRNGKPFYVGDNNHISHRFLHMGFSRATSVMLVHLLALTIGLGALPILWGDWATCALLLAQSVVFLTILSVVQCAGKQKEN